MTIAPPNFATFRDGSGGIICKRLGIDISSVGTWRDYTEAMVRLNARNDHLVDAAKRLNRVVSSGEAIILHATLAAADFAGLADEMARHTWHRMSILGRDETATVAAAILRSDR